MFYHLRSHYVCRRQKSYHIGWSIINTANMLRSRQLQSQNIHEYTRIPNPCKKPMALKKLSPGLEQGIAISLIGHTSDLVDDEISLLEFLV